MIGVLAGEGVGPEVVGAALAVLRAVAAHSQRRIELRTGGPIGAQAQRTAGKALTDDVIAFCEQVFDDGGALFCGPGGGRFVYELRARFDLYCKLTPLRPAAALRDVGALRPAHLDAVDIVAVRENTGGFYFGEWGAQEHDGVCESAFHRVTYRADEVDRVLDVGCRLARARRGKLCVTVKPGGVPTISRLWEDRARRVSRDGNVEVRILEIDNAAYQLIADPRSFDVIVSPNMFGDILADCGALLLGSRGMSHSGNFGPDRRAVYQTGHGAAHDIAGTDTANPIGQIRSLAMMLRESFDWPEAARSIDTAIERVLAEGTRTRDIAGAGCTIVGTRELGARIADAVAATA